MTALAGKERSVLLVGSGGRGWAKRKMEMVAVCGDRVTASVGGHGGTEAKLIFQGTLTLVHTERVQLMGRLRS